MEVCSSPGLKRMEEGMVVASILFDRKDFTRLPGTESSLFVEKHEEHGRFNKRYALVRKVRKPGRKADFMPSAFYSKVFCQTNRLVRLNEVLFLTTYLLCAPAAITCDRCTHRRTGPATCHVQVRKT